MCETIMTKYRDSYAAIEAARLLRTLKPSEPQNPSLGAAPSSSASPSMPAATPASSPGGKR